MATKAKTTAKKRVVKKTTARKPAAKKTMAKKPAAKPAVKKPMASKSTDGMSRMNEPKPAVLPWRIGDVQMH